MKPKVKVCGITTQEDAVLAESLGADFIGFIFFQKSPRFVGADRAADIVSHTRGIVKPVGVFVEEDFEAVKYAGYPLCNCTEPRARSLSSD